MRRPALFLSIATVTLISLWSAYAQQEGVARRAAAESPDAVERAQSVRNVEIERAEQQKSPHDQSSAFDASKARPSSPAFEGQPKEGRITGFDFYRDPLNAPQPFTTFEEVMRAESAAKADVMARQRELLDTRYDLEPRLDSEVTMSRGKPLCVGPTARLQEDLTWESLAGRLHLNS